GALRMQRKRFIRFDCLINFSQSDAFRDATEPRASAGASASLDKSRCLQQEKQPPNDDRVGVDAGREQDRCHRLAFFVSEHSQHMHSHGKSTTRSHAQYVTVLITYVKCAMKIKRRR